MQALGTETGLANQGQTKGMFSHKVKVWTLSKGHGESTEGI